MAKVVLIVIGVIIIILTFFIMQSLSMTKSIKVLQTTDAVCNAEVKIGGIDLKIGSAGQKLLGKEGYCRQVHFFLWLMTFGWVFYIIGILFVFFGIALKETKFTKEKEKT